MKNKWIVDYGILNTLKGLIDSSKRFKNDDSKYWAINLLHQIAMCNDLQDELVKMGFIKDLAIFTREFYGNTGYQKMGLHSVVRLLASVELNQVKLHLNDLEKFNFSKTVATAIKQDDIELSCWAAFLMRKFI